MPPLKRRMNARVPLLLGEAREVPFVLLHVRAEARPERAPLFVRERYAVDENLQAQDAVSCAISWACLVTSTFR